MGNTFPSPSNKISPGKPAKRSSTSRAEHKPEYIIVRQSAANIVMLAPPNWYQAGPGATNSAASDVTPFEEPKQPEPLQLVELGAEDGPAMGVSEKGYWRGLNVSSKRSSWKEFEISAVLGKRLTGSTHAHAPLPAKSKPGNASSKWFKGGGAGAGAGSNSSQR